MHAFWRIFKYVKFQWPRVVVVILAAVLIAFLFALSFMTVVPLLKVMMGQEGLHGMVDRKICDWRYGVDFHVPELADFDVNDPDITFYLRITGIEKGGAAYTAGLVTDDRIIGVGKTSISDSIKRVPRNRLLEELADCPEKSSISIQVKRINQEGNLEPFSIQLDTGQTPSHLNFAINSARSLVDFVPSGKGNKEKAVMFIILLMAAVTFVRCIATFYQKYLAEKIVQTAIARLREEAFAHTMTIPVGFFSSEGTSDTVSRLIGDINGIGMGIKVLLGKALREPLKAVFCLAGAMWFSWKLTLIFLLCAPFTFGLAIMLGRKIKKYTKRSLASIALMLGKLEGAIGALRVVKVYNRQAHESHAYQVINRRYLKQRLRVAKIDTSTGPTMEVLGMIAGSGALLVGIHWITKGNMEAPSFFGLLILLGTSAESIRKASDVWNKVQTANAAAERVFAVIDEPSEYESKDAVELGPLKAIIEFRDVVFSYPGRNGSVLKGINLSVKAGQNIAIVGPNGSGKTTLINLLPRFYNPDSGAILIDGQDIGDVTLRSLRDKIGMVTQDVVTFNDTIAANIAYGNPLADMDEIIAASRRSFAHEFIEVLADGYDTMIGEHGAGLSGGQLQRIVIARAILKDPDILIFDEATSQVDADSEAKIHKAIEEMMRERTSFIIAHRFSTIINADVIAVMDEGRIIAQGRHESLIKECRLYQSLYERQLITSH